MLRHAEIDPGLDCAELKERRENLSEAPASRRPAGQDRRPDGTVPFYGLMLTATEGPQVAFLRATDPSTGRQRRIPRDGVILLGWRTADCDSGHVYCCSTLARTTLITPALGQLGDGNPASLRGRDVELLRGLLDGFLFRRSFY